MTYIKTKSDCAKEVLSSINVYSEIIVILSLHKYKTGQKVIAFYAAPGQESLDTEFEGFIESCFYDIDLAHWTYQVCDEEYKIKELITEVWLDRWNSEKEQEDEK